MWPSEPGLLAVSYMSRKIPWGGQLAITPLKSHGLGISRFPHHFMAHRCSVGTTWGQGPLGAKWLGDQGCAGEKLKQKQELNPQPLLHVKLQCTLTDADVEKIRMLYPHQGFTLHHFLPSNFFNFFYYILFFFWNSGFLKLLDQDDVGATVAWFHGTHIEPKLL
jgi:hypothetical protein